MLKAQPLKPIDGKLLLQYSFEDLDGDQVNAKQLFENKSAALLHYAGACYSYSLQKFDQLRQVAFQNGIKLPSWTDSLLEMDVTSIALSLKEIKLKCKTKEVENYLNSRLAIIKVTLQEWSKIKNHLKKENEEHKAAINLSNYLNWGYVYKPFYSRDIVLSVDYSIARFRALR